MTVRDMAQAARNAQYGMAGLGGDARRGALMRIRQALLDHRQALFDANAADMTRAESESLASPLLRRMRFDEHKLQEVTDGLTALAALPDPLGQTLTATELADGLDLYRVRCAIGVIGIVFESRPDALVQIAALCLKTGNAVLLKGGREAAQTNRALFDLITDATRGILPDGWIALMQSREDVGALLELDDLVDLIIPRGSNAFVKYIMDHTRIPVMGHADGICHVYVDVSADIDMAVKVAVDAKTQYPAVCNAAETLLVHRDIARDFLPRCYDALLSKGVTVVGDAATRAVIPCGEATDADWSAEYLDLKLSVKAVDSLTDAVSHINRFGSHHTDAIIASDEAAQREFVTRVDSAGVYVNCSTRFADGFRYGFGAEVGVSTGKLHARGPVGIEGLCTYKYVLLGSGQTVAETVDGTVTYTHRGIDHDCPI